MIYGMSGVFHIRRYTMCRIMEADTSKRIAITEVNSPSACSLRIFRTLGRVSFSALFGFVEACLLWAECALFSTKVLHARFTARLSVFSPFKWLTVGREGSGFRNAIATSLWTNRVSPKLTRGYPFLESLVLRTRFVLMRRTRPRSLTSYFLFSATVFQRSMAINSGWCVKNIAYHKRGG